jgi:hypothetical protein
MGILKHNRHVWRQLQAKVTSSMFMLLVLPEFNPLDLTFRQIRSYMDKPGLVNGPLASEINQGIPTEYVGILGMSVGIILFFISSVYFHHRKKQKQGL